MKPSSTTSILLASSLAVFWLISDSADREGHRLNVSYESSTVQTSTCTFTTSPTIVKQDGNAVLQYWLMQDEEVFYSSELPDDSSFLEFRRSIQQAGANIERPIADRPKIETEDERLLWAREDANVDRVFQGGAGRVRPMMCLDALLFSYQNARFPQLTHPTEFIASILKKVENGTPMIKLYFAAGDTMFPPRGFYGLDAVARDVADGWDFVAALHNHTVQENEGKPALGVPAPSTSDVDLLRNLSTDLNLRNAWVTNGFFTVEIPSSVLDEYHGRSDR